MFSPVWQMILTFLKSYDHCIYLRPCYFICWLLGEIFSILWIIPFFLLSKLINVFLFQDIADCVYTPTRGLSRSKSKQISIPDLICSLGVQILFLLQITLLNYNPFPALTYPCYALRMFLTCLLYSQYAFEYKWINMGLNLSARLNFIENEWPYFFGFGLPMFLCSEYPESFFASSFVFSVVFPFFIITGSAGSPPYDTGYITLPVFFPTMYMINRIVSLFSKSDTNTHHTQQNR
nr:etoposide-induced protein 2.4 homolog isoform X1 [Leptinotarsa decemlineata]